MSGPASRRCACVDVGSNTTALLVADVSPDALRTVATERRFTLLGETAAGAPLPEDKLVATVDAVSALVASARELGAESVELIATHVVREASNGAELCRRVERSIGLPLRMIDGHKEAEYSCVGATGGLARLRGETVVIDAGGGSTEISICRPNEAPVTASYAIGSARLRRDYLLADPPTPEQLESARSIADEAFSDFTPPNGLRQAIAVGGGATTAQKLMGGVIDASGVRRVLELCQKSSAAELAASLGLEPARAALLPSSLVILGALTQRVGIELEVGLGGLREGVLLERAAIYSRVDNQ
ncbi:MAG: hypothetical protein ACPGYP_00580 [Solirubrobacterales bacterium]